MDRLWIGLSLLAIFIIGLIDIYALFNKYFVKTEFLRDYRNKFIEFVNARQEGNFKQELYQFLSLNASKAQRIAGQIAKGSYSASYQRYNATNYEFIINTIPKFRSEYHLKDTEITFVDDILMMAIGERNETVDYYRKELKNPFKWLQYGVRFIMKLPVQIFKWFGVISDGTYFKITTNGIFKFFAGIAALIGFVSGIVGLITGWNAFLVIINELIGKFFP